MVNKKIKLNWLKKKKEGLYCIPGKFFIDPILPVDKALITHAHADHARPYNKKILSSLETKDLMKIRYGQNYCSSFQCPDYHKRIKINDVYVTLYPAGHILGSLQFLIEFKGHRLLISGDYKRSKDLTCKEYEPVKCHTFITEATFGLPIFSHPCDKIETQKLIKSLYNNDDSTHLIGVYALGKCQRLISLLRSEGYNETIYLHGAMINISEYYIDNAIKLGNIKKVSEHSPNDMVGKLILCPPSALNDKWSQKFKNVIKGCVSGWMKIKQRIKQKNIELPIIISDHSDWNDILTTIKDVSPYEVLVTHGREEALVYYLNKKSYLSKALNLIGFEDENE